MIELPIICHDSIGPIELGASRQELRRKCTYQGVNVFDTPAEELFSLIAASEGDGSTHAFDDCGYVFPNQIFSLWEADSQYDYLGGEIRPIWANVGIGDARYWEAVKKYQ